MSSFQCRECNGQVFSSDADLAAHRLTDGETHRRISCIVMGCARTFVTMDEVQSVSKTMPHYMSRSRD